MLDAMLNSNYYYRFAGEIFDRLDFVFYHPNMDFIKAFRNSSNAIRFGELLDRDEDGQPIAYYGVTASGQLEGDIKFVNIQNLSEHGMITGDTTYLDEDSVPERLHLRIGDILISRSRLVGRAAIVTEDWENQTFGSYIIMFRLNPTIGYVPKYVVKFINSRLGKAQVTLLMTGSSGYNINSTQLMDIRLPSLDHNVQEQILQTIGEIEREAQHIDELAVQRHQVACESLLSDLGIDIDPDFSANYFFKTGAEKQTLWYYVLGSTPRTQGGCSIIFLKNMGGVDHESTIAG